MAGWLVESLSEGHIACLQRLTGSFRKGNKMHTMTQEVGRQNKQNVHRCEQNMNLGVLSSKVKYGTDNESTKYEEGSHDNTSVYDVLGYCEFLVRKFIA